MPKRAADTQGTAQRGRALVRAELEQRGATVREVRDGGVVFLELAARAGGRPSRIRVKTRSSGTWQASASDGDARPTAGGTRTFWVFVDLAAKEPSFFVVRDAAIRRDIGSVHREYLARHGGKRRDNDASNHHAIQADRVERLDEGWEVLGP